MITLLLTVQLSIPTSASVAYAGLGGLSHYNVIIFDEFYTEGGIVEGALASKNSVTVSSSGGAVCIIASAADGAGLFNQTIGSLRLPEHESHPSLVLGGYTLSFNTNNLNVQSVSTHSAVIATLTTNASLIDSLGQQTLTTSEDSFNTFFNSIEKAITKTILKAKLFVRSAPLPDADFGIGKSTSDTGLLLSSIDVQGTLNISQTNIPNFDDELLLIYSEATSVNFESGALMYDTDNDYSYLTPLNMSNETLLDTLSHNIIWIFPNATSINCHDFDIVGTLLAPNATFLGDGGSISGQLIANSVNQISDFRINNYIFDWSNFNSLSLPIIQEEEEEEDSIDIPDEDELDPEDDLGLVDDGLVDVEITFPLSLVEPLSTPVPGQQPTTILQGNESTITNTDKLVIKTPFAPPFDKNNNYYWIDYNSNFIIDAGELVASTGSVKTSSPSIHWSDKNADFLIETAEIDIEEDLIPLDVTTLPQTAEIPEALLVIFGSYLILIGFKYKRNLNELF